MSSSEPDDARTLCCPECGRVTSVAPWCKRPICVHSWGGTFVPEVWDGDDWDGEGTPIEQAPHKPSRTPGPHSWTEMVEWNA